MLKLELPTAVPRSLAFAPFYFPIVGRAPSDILQLLIREIFHGLVRFIWLYNVHDNS